MTKKTLKNPLSEQKIYKRNKKKFSSKNRLTLFSILTLSGLFFTFPYLDVALKHYYNFLINEQILEKKIIIKAPETPLALDTIKNIKKIITQINNFNDAENLIKSAKTIQNLYNFSEVHFIKIDKKTIFVSIKKRKPHLLIMVDQIRYLTKKGLVYGTPTLEEKISLTTVYGIFSEKKRTFSFASDSSFIMDTSKKILVKEAIELYDKTVKEQIYLKQITYVPYRGFTAITKKDSTLITMGRVPFDNQIHRLKSILIKLNQKGIQAQKIELDYEGKAFIKEKKT